MDDTNSCKEEEKKEKASEETRRIREKHKVNQ